MHDAPRHGVEESLEQWVAVVMAQSAVMLATPRSGAKRSLKTLETKLMVVVLL